MLNNLLKIVIPTCQKCSGILNIKINPLNFSIEYDCENNESHKDKNIYFKSFERFYLKEKGLKQCSNCLIILENSEFFECYICKKKYCCRCYIKDVQENGHKCKDNNYTNNRCPIHYNDLTEYCYNCNKNICISCTMSDDNKNHKIICFHNCIPSVADIKNLKVRIKEKSLFHENLIKKIDEWKRKMNQKIEELKQNLRDEISLLEKIIFNFNNNFRNYSYFENFKYINNNINSTTNNQYLLEFYNCLSFEKQTEILMTIFKYIGKKANIKQNKIGYLKTIQMFNNYKFVEKIDENYFIGYEELNKNVYFFYFNKFNDIINSIYNYYIEDGVLSISKSTLENKIFICLPNKKVKIISYDFEKMSFNLSEIIDTTFNNYYVFNYNNNCNHKCIQLSAELYAILENNITIWSIKEKIYSKIQNINANCDIQDMLLLDKDYFMCSSSSNQKLIIYDIEKFSVLKVINNIDCRNENNILLKINDNLLLINCYKGIGIFDNKNKEIIQYTEEYYSPLNTIIILDKFNNVYITHIKIEQNNNNSGGSLFGSSNNVVNDSIIKIFYTEISNREIILCEEYEKITIKDKNIKNIFCFNNEILIFGEKIYKVSEANNNIFNNSNLNNNIKIIN